MKHKRTTWSVPRIRDPRFPGFQLRITELVHDGPLYYARQINGKPVFKKLQPEVTRKSLGTDAKRKAVAIAMGLIEHLATSPDEVVPEPGAALTLGGLIKKFETDGLAGRTERYKKGMLTSIKRIRDHLGADLALKDLKPSHVQKWMAHRNGVLVAGQRDLVSLSIVINWGIGEGLLDANPLATKMARKAMHTDHKPRRVVMEAERYKALVAVADQFPPAFGVLLSLGWNAGHRISAMVGARDGEFPGLRWRDISFKATNDAPHGTITWYPDIKPDKKKHEHTVAMNPVASAILARWRQQTGGVAKAFLFTHPDDPNKPLSYYDCKRWLKRAETKAGLQHRKQDGWHALRRAWATARKMEPLKDVMAVGGWKDTATLAEVYQQPDAETTKRVALHVA
jgi:integrase